MKSKYTMVVCLLLASSINAFKLRDNWNEEGKPNAKE